jgi:ribosome-binding factor A
MSYLRPSRSEGRILSAEFREEDRQASRRLSRHARKAHGARRLGPSGSAGDRKALQLCRQVAQTLDAVLAECGDAVLHGLTVTSVAPFPDASRLLVTLTPFEARPGKSVDARSILDHVKHAAGHLRREVATAVTRRRAPLLVYQLAEPSVAEAERAHP